MAEELEREILWQAEVRQSGGLPEDTAGPAKSQGATFASFLKKLFGLFGLVSLVDQILVSTGLAAALASAGFAVMMMSTDHSHPMFGGIEHLMLFAQPLHRNDPTLMARTEKEQPAEPGIDYNTTGTIPHRQLPGVDRDDLPPLRLPATEPVIKAYVVQEARIGIALVQGRGAAYRVLPGAFLPGAGRVLSIEQRDGRWVVVTTQGVIIDRLSAQWAP